MVARAGWYKSPCHHLWAPGLSCLLAQPQGPSRGLQFTFKRQIQSLLQSHSLLSDKLIIWGREGESSQAALLQRQPEASNLSPVPGHLFCHFMGFIYLFISQLTLWLKLLKQLLAGSNFPVAVSCHQSGAEAVMGAAPLGQGQEHSQPPLSPSLQVCTAPLHKEELQPWTCGTPCHKVLLKWRYCQKID